jgi:metalloendopeptidase OMA1, mitochondrial
MGTRFACLILLIFSCLFSAMSLISQDACPVPPYALPTKAPNIFTERQDVDLGDAMAEQFQNTYRVIDDEVTDYARKIGQRLVAQLPDSKLQYQFYLVDFPSVNAFALPGGRVYVARKLVAACKSEDELAGVIAHEIGHIATRQESIEYTRYFQKLLGVSSVGDRKDIFDKFNKFLDNIARNPGLLKDVNQNDSDEQLVADRVSVYLAKRAGYSPEAYVQLWDRIAEVHGKTGSVLGDIFRRPKPEQKRLRSMQRLVDQLPAACAGPRPENTPQKFEEWKVAVAAYSGAGHRESLPTAEWKRKLNPALRNSLYHMRFSRDGKYLLAQDQSSVFVLSREPFELLFRIDAPNAMLAQFTPDSESITFTNQQLHVEIWSVQEEQRTTVQDMAVPFECMQFKVSPDGKHFACLDVRMKLTMYNVSDGSQIVHRDPKERSSLVTIGGGLDIVLSIASQSELNGQLEFSPDGRYVLATDTEGKDYFAYDFVDGKSLKLPDSITSRLGRSFSFLADGRFIGVAGKFGENTAVVSFPAGEVLQTMEVGNSATVHPAANPNYLLLKPIDKYAIGVMDLTQKKIFLASKQDAIDLYGNYFVSERNEGVLSLFQIKEGKEELLGRAELPQSPLVRTRVASLSPDLNYLAVSARTRGAIWDLRKGDRVFVNRNFTGAYFTPDNILMADFPRTRDENRVMARVNPATSSFSAGPQIRNPVHNQQGLYVVERRRNPMLRQSPFVLAFLSAETGQQLWIRAFPEPWPRVIINSDDDKAVFVFPASSEWVKNESINDPALKKKIESVKNALSDFYIQVVQASTGKIINSVYVETGQRSFQVGYVEASGDYLAVYDDQQRILIYSISSGKRLGQLFGLSGDLSPAAQLLAVENSPGVVEVYSLPSMEKRGKLVFGNRLVYAKFSKDGKHFFALTGDQNTYLFGTAAITSPQTAQQQ